MNYLVLIIGTVITMYPVLWVLVSSFKGRREFAKDYFFPAGKWHFEHYVQAWVDGNFGTYYFNSIFVTFFSVSLGILFASLAAYAFTRLEFKGRNIIFYAFLATMMFPPQLGLIPLFLIFKKLHLLNTYWALIIPYTNGAIPVSMFLLRGYFKQLPYELDEAAMVDGANHLTIFFKLILPMSKPVLATTFMMTALGTWNEYLLALTFIQDEALKTLPVGIIEFQNQLAVNYPMLMSGNVLSFLPMVLVFIFLQKYFIKGITGGALD